MDIHKSVYVELSIHIPDFAFGPWFFCIMNCHRIHQMSQQMRVYVCVCAHHFRFKLGSIYSDPNYVTLGHTLQHTIVFQFLAYNNLSHSSSNSNNNNICQVISSNAPQLMRCDVIRNGERERAEEEEHKKGHNTNGSYPQNNQMQWTNIAFVMHCLRSNVCIYRVQPTI